MWGEGARRMGYWGRDKGTGEVVKRAGVKYIILGDTRGWALGAEVWVE
jgi:hypothetical protein